MQMHPKASDLGADIFHRAELFSTIASKQTGDLAPEDGSYGLYGALAAVGGALKTLAELISDGEEGKTVYGQATKESMLVAALLAARTFIPWKDKDSNGVLLDFSGRNFLAAVEAANKVNETDVWDKLNQHIVKAYREGYVTKNQTLGYWDYVPDIGPQFEGMSEAMTSLTKH